MSSVEEILEMSVEDLKKAMISLGQDPSGLKKSAMQGILIQHGVGASVQATSLPMDTASGPLPPFLAKLAPELQLQWWMRQEEKRAIQEEKRAAEAKALADHNLAVERFRMEQEAKAAVASAAAQAAAAAAAAAALVEREKREAAAAAAAAAAQVDRDKREAALVSARIEAEMKAAELDARRAEAEAQRA